MIFTRREALALLLGGATATLLPTTLRGRRQEEVWPRSEAMGRCRRQGHRLSQDRRRRRQLERQDSPGVTGIVLTGFCQTGKVGAERSDGRQRAQVHRVADQSQGGPHRRQGPRVQLQNYVTCVNVMALNAAEQADSYKAVIADAAKFLRSCSGTRAKARQKEDDFYGGAGYDSKSRPDLSNTQFFLDALVAAGVPKDDPAFKKALIFVSRCQNLKGENNDRPGPARSTTAASSTARRPAASTKVQRQAESRRRSARLRQHDLRRHQEHDLLRRRKDDPRIKKAIEWLKKNYTVDANPGMPEAARALGPVLLLPHDGEVPRRAWAIDEFKSTPKARSTTGGRHHRGAGQAAAGRRQLDQRQRPLDGRPIPTSSPATR